MSGALNSVMGGSGGGLLGAVGGIVGGMFGGPIGAMVGQAVGNMLQEAVGDAVKDAATELNKEHGMPKFIADAIKEAVGDAVGQLKNKDVDETTQDQVSNDPEVKGWMQQFTADLTKMIVENSKNLMSEDKGDGKASGKSTSKNGATSWLEAIAIAMGEAAGNKAAKLVELSNKLTELSTAGGDEEEQQAAAKEMNAVNAQFQATSQEFNMLQNAFSNAIKAIGEGMAAMARKG